jgi:hypothetical protein
MHLQHSPAVPGWDLCGFFGVEKGQLSWARPVKRGATTEVTHQFLAMFWGIGAGFCSNKAIVGLCALLVSPSVPVSITIARMCGPKSVCIP